ncbi:Transmembrane_domain-containing protein [Hexamita inflata]|uniref:Transmembrane domain-containing protein n=1 Tax=Hexamita inflata TaxID=28002 RepID=A0AA86NDC8_9EUKA|nr:Transmembrane domain-containing protein [Hexamita inflata]
MIEMILLKHFLLDIVLQQYFYLPNKDIPFGKDILIHVLIVSVPWLIISKFSHLNVICFVIEFISHWMIDVTKTKYRKKNKPTGFRKWRMHFVDQFLHLVVLVLNWFILK